MTFALAAPVAAHHGDDLPDPDNTTQCVKSPSITGDSITARNRGFAQLDRTDIDTQYCTGDDIWVQDAYYGRTGWSGATNCSDLTNNLFRCDVYTVKFNETYIHSYSTTYLNHLGCHEFGHTGSVGHRPASSDTDNNSCMRRGKYNLTSLDAHDIRSINAGV